VLLSESDEILARDKASRVYRQGLQQGYFSREMAETPGVMDMLNAYNAVMVEKTNPFVSYTIPDSAIPCLRPAQGVPSADK